MKNEAVEVSLAKMGNMVCVKGCWGWGGAWVGEAQFFASAWRVRKGGYRKKIW